VSTLGISEWKLLHTVSKSFYVSEFGKVAVTSTPARNSFLRAHVALKLETGIHRHIDSEFRHTPKNFQGVLLKHILKKNTVFRKKGVKIWTFDGICLFPNTSMLYHLFSIKFHILRWNKIDHLHCKRRLAIFPSPAGMSQTKISLARIIKYSRPGRAWLVTSRLVGPGKLLTFFYSVVHIPPPHQLGKREPTFPTLVAVVTRLGCFSRKSFTTSGWSDCAARWICNRTDQLIVNSEQMVAGIF
jgi:hypothetical protein